MFKNAWSTSTTLILELFGMELCLPCLRIDKKFTSQNLNKIKGNKMKIRSTKTEKKVIDMSIYGLSTVVHTTQEELDAIKFIFMNNPRKIAGWNGLKKELLNYLGFVILKEDQYFSLAKTVSKKDEQRWADFMEDCLNYSCLHSHLNEIDVPARNSNGLQAEISHFQPEQILAGSKNDWFFVKNGTGS